MPIVLRNALDELRQHVRDARRSLTKTPVSTTGALLSIALGIAANTGVASLFKATMLETLAFRDPGRLAVVWTTPALQPDATELVSVPDSVRLKEHRDVFERVGAFQVQNMTVGPTEDGRPAEELVGQRFTATMFEALGVQPALGRVLTDADDRTDAPSLAVVISHRLWQNRFGGDPRVLTKTLVLDGVARNIVGVMPPAFSLFEEHADFWLPMNFASAQLRGTQRVLTVVARLIPGVSLEQARARMEGVAAELARLDPVRNAGRGIHLQSLETAYYGDLRHLLVILQGAVGLVLLLACANVAGLLLIRASNRTREVAIRAALGADRARILRQFLTESVLLALAGGAIGLLLASWGLDALVASGPAWLSHVQQIPMDLPVLAVAAAMSVATGLACGIGPALHLMHAGLVAALKDGARGTLGGRRLQRTMVTAQIALTLMLLVGAGLVVKSVWHLQRRDLGFDPRGVLSFQTRVPANPYLNPLTTSQGLRWDISPSVAPLFEQVRTRLHNVPGVISVAGMNVPPVSQLAMQVPFTIEGDASDRTPLATKYYFVTPGFFSTMRMAVRQGRDFSDRDIQDRPWVAVINEAMARQFWPGVNPIGRRLRVSLVPDEQPREIVGVVRDVPLSRWDRASTPTLYVSYLQQPRIYVAPYAAHRARLTFLMRTTGDTSAVADFVRAAVADVAPDLPVARIEMVDRYLARQIDAPRYYMVFLGGFAGVAVILAAIGIYGVVASSVARRAKELAIRLALGAQKPRVVALVLGESLAILGFGIPMGIAGAFGLTRFIRTVLWGVTTTDPFTFVAATLLLPLVTIVATFVPAARVLRLDPRQVLYEE